MRRRVAAAGRILAVAALAACASSPAPAPASPAAAAAPRVLLATELGDIVLELEPAAAPVTVANFLRYVDEGRFAGATFYRTVTLEPDNQPHNEIKIEVIQGGLGFEERPEALPPITHETTADSGLLHRDGTVSMARLGPGTASSEFFICVGDQPELDYGGRRNPDGQGFAAFGRVVEGMGVVRRIHHRSAKDQMLRRPVAIRRVARLPPGG